MFRCSKQIGTTSKEALPYLELYRETSQSASQPVYCVLFTGSTSAGRALAEIGNQKSRLTNERAILNFFKTRCVQKIEIWAFSQKHLLNSDRGRDTRGRRCLRSRIIERLWVCLRQTRSVPPGE